MNQRHDQSSGGNDRIALLLKAASATTSAGNNRKPRMAVTVAPPTKRRRFGNAAPQCWRILSSGPAAARINASTTNVRISPATDRLAANGKLKLANPS